MNLPNEWKEVKLGDVAKVTSGGTPLRSVAEYWNGNVPWVKTAQIQNSHIALNQVDEYITELGVSESSAKIIPAGTLLMAMYGQGKTRGQVAILDFPAAINQACAAFNLDKTQVARDYLYQYFLFSYEDLRAVSNSGGQQNLSADLIKKFAVTLPPLAEQKKIAETLSVWDSAIEKMEKLIENKEMLKKHVFFELTSSQQQSWEKHILSEFLIPGDKKPVSDTSAYKKITVKLHKKGIEFNQQTREMADTRPFYVRRKGELIIGKQNYFNGSIAIVDELYDGSICSNAIMSFKIKNVNSFFLYELLSDESYLHKHEMLANGTGQKELSEKDFLNFEIYVPSPKEQNRIAEILNIYEKELSLLKQQLALYKKQKQGLMQKLLTGEWRVK